MVELYKERGVQGKCGANRFLMNLTARKDDSTTIARDEIDKAVVIQNLFRRPSNRAERWKFF